MSEELKLVKIDKAYCNYLRKYDNRVIYNADTKENRPFIGVLFEVKQCKYFAPLSSPKPKHQTMKNNVDFLKIDHGKLGAINFNNMIPVENQSIELIDIEKDNKNAKDKEYNNLMKKQIYWLNRNKETLYSKSLKLYTKYINNKLDLKVRERCCNFKLLEEKCVEWNEKNRID